MAKHKNTEKPAANDKPNTAPHAGALGADADARIPNSQSTHQGLHDSHEADLHFDGDVHMEDENEKGYSPPGMLDAPEARPGMVQRWIRISLLGKSDGKNQSSQNQAGWRPRGLDTVPGGQRGRYSTIRDRRTSGEFIVNGDLILCEMTAGRFKAMQDHFRGKSRGQVNVLDEQIASARQPGAEEHGFGDPQVLHRKTRVTTRRPIAQADQ